MRVEKSGNRLQRFRKYSSSCSVGTAGFDAEKRRRFRRFSTGVGRIWSEVVFLRRFSIEFPQALWKVFVRGLDRSSKLLHQSVEHAREIRIVLPFFVDPFDRVHDAGVM